MIIHGDCFSVLPTLTEGSVNLIVTSPPYADKRENAYGGIPPAEYASWLLEVSELSMRVLATDGSFILNVKEGCTNGVRDIYVIEYLLAMSKRYLWVDEFIWHKTNPFPTGSKKRLKDAWEHCFHFAKTDKYKFFPDAVSAKSTSKWSNISRKNKGAFATKNGSGMNMSKRVTSELVRPSNVISGSKSCANTSHPAVFPPYLPSFFVSLLTKKEDVVLDPFAGSGTTLVVARDLGRKWIGIEKHFHYVELAKERLTREDGDDSMSSSASPSGEPHDSENETQERQT